MNVKNLRLSVLSIVALAALGLSASCSSPDAYILQINLSELSYVAADQPITASLTVSMQMPEGQIELSEGAAIKACVQLLYIPSQLTDEKISCYKENYSLTQASQTLDISVASPQSGWVSGYYYFEATALDDSDSPHCVQDASVYCLGGQE